MAADELLQMHETVGGALGRVLNFVDVYAWVIPGSLLVLLFVAFFRRFVIALPATTRRSLSMSFFLFVGGAIVDPMLDLQTDPEGNFYYAKAGPVKGGGRGFDYIAADEALAGPQGNLLQHRKLHHGTCHQRYLPDRWR